MKSPSPYVPFFPPPPPGSMPENKTIIQSQPQISNNKPQHYQQNKNNTYNGPNHYTPNNPNREKRNIVYVRNIPKSFNTSDKLMTFFKS